MLKFIFLKTKIPQKDQGFTMLEVLVAGLIAFFFIIGSLQAMVLATMLRVQSLEKERANELIQEDKEAVKALAVNFQIPAGTNLSNLCAPADAANGFAQLFRDTNTNLGGLGGLGIGKLAVPANKKVLNSYDSNETKGRTLLLSRTAINIGQYPFKTLTINYQVNRTINGTSADLTDQNRLIATDTLEVMPNVALQCP